MKKIAIVTMYGMENFGNRLQNYAMQVVLQKKGCEVDSIVLRDDVAKYGNKLKKLVKKIYTKVIRNKKSNLHKRFFSFLEFQEYINTSVIDDLSKIGTQRDLFVVGSDQVWNPYVVNDFFMLKFVPECKRVAVAASFGVEELEEKLLDYYRDGLNRFKKISVREETGIILIQNIIKERVEEIIDPTLMLGREEWDAVEKSVQGELADYVLVNLLGINNYESVEVIKKIAKEYNLRIIDINDNTSCYFGIGPSEYIHLIKKATLVCTNSFHTIIFSMIYEKNFIAFRRSKEKDEINTRIECLLKKFRQERRWIDLILPEEIFQCSYDETSKILLKEKSKFSNFIDEMLDL